MQKLLTPKLSLLNLLKFTFFFVLAVYSFALVGVERAEAQGVWGSPGGAYNSCSQSAPLCYDWYIGNPKDDRQGLACSSVGSTRWFVGTSNANSFPEYAQYTQRCEAVAISCVGNWSVTSGATCSATCGGGTIQETYNISVPASGGGTPCGHADGATRNVSCNNVACPDPDPDPDPVHCQGSWSWGSCSASCGGGTQLGTYNVTRPAAHGGNPCSNADGDVRNRACNTHSCGGTSINCGYTWNDWSSCNNSCGRGTQSRTTNVYRSPSGTGLACPSSPESRSCTDYSGCPDPSVWTTYCTGGSDPNGNNWEWWRYDQYGTYEFVRNGDGSCTPPSDPGPDPDPDPDPGPDPDPVVNCVGSWSTYGSCSVSCGPGTRTSTYTVTTPASGGGDACDFADGDTDVIGCDAGACGNISAGGGCDIAVGDSTCSTNVTWSSSYAELPVRVTQNGSTFSNDISDSESRSVGLGTTLFRIADNNSSLDTDTINTTCAPGARWSSGMCKTNIGPPPGIDIEINPDQSLFSSGVTVEVTGVVTTDDSLRCELTALAQSQTADTSPPLSTNSIGPITGQLSAESVFTFTCDIISGTEVFSDGSTSATVTRTVEVIPTVEEI